MNQLCSTLGILRNKSPEILFTQNLERLEEEGDCYDLGQLCAMALWTLTGDLRSSKKDSPEVWGWQINQRLYFPENEGLPFGISLENNV